MENRPADIVEQHLRSQYANNLRQKIWPSNNAVIERLLKDSDNLRDAWGELLGLYVVGHKALGRTHDKWQVVIDTIVDVAAGWSPEKTKKTRQALKDVTDCTKEIQAKAIELASLLRKRTRICEESSISKRPMDFHPIDLFGPAAQIADRQHFQGGNTRYCFKNYVEGKLKDLTDQFDLKYWPRTADVIEALAELQEDAEFSGDQLSDAAILINQASKRDFMRVLDNALGDLSDLDINMTFSHANYAAIVNAACGLDQTVEGSSIKKYRQDERKRAG